MNDISMVAMFCADVRQEKGGTETIVGVFPDSVSLPNIPGAFSQMYVYVRMHMRPAFQPQSIITRLVLPDGNELDRTAMDADLMETARQKALANGSPYLGLVAKFVMAPMKVTQEGRLQAIVAVDGEDYVAGVLNFRMQTT